MSETSSSILQSITSLCFLFPFIPIAIIVISLSLPLLIPLLFLMIGLLVPLSAFAFFVYQYLFAPIMPRPSPLRSVQVGDAKPNQTEPRVNAIWSKKTPPSPIDGAKTLRDLFLMTVEKYGSRPALGVRRTVKTEEIITKVKNDQGKEVEKKVRIPYCTPYEYRSYDELLIEVQKFSSGLVKTGPGLTDGNSRLAIFASTRPEWQVAAQAAFLRGITVVTVYPSLGADALQFSLHQTEVTHVVTQASLIETILKAADRLPVLSSIIYFDDIKPEKLSEYQTKYPNISFHSYNQVLIDGADKKPSSYIPTENDVAVIMYTSGSTGNPKGVMISHKNALALVNAAAFGIPKPVTEADVIIAYLPLAHILEMACESGVMAAGGCVGYSSPFTLRDDQVRDLDGKPAGDLSTLRPTLMAAVPLILDRIRSAILDKVNKSGPIMRMVFKSAFHLKQRAWLLGESTPLLDKLVFKKIANQFGGRLRYLLSGGAPLSKDTQLFINVCFCATILQGYALTETAAGGTISHPDDRILGVVGPPIAGVTIKLVDIPDMNYTAADQPYPRGEVWISGPTVTLGYFKMHEKTAEDFKEEKDGSRWFATGDVGQWLPDGNLQIIDRKKDLVKLIHGEYIALGKCESVYLHSSLIENICVYGDADHDRPIALVVANLINLGKAALHAGVPECDTHDLKSLVRHPKVHQIVMHSLADQAKKNHLEKWEQLAAIHLCDESWTPESGMLTEAMKLKRHEITKRFKAELERTYASI